MTRAKEISGLKFGRLLVIKKYGKVGTRLAWECKCDCGKNLIVQSNNIGRTTFSCGCLKIENIKKQSRKTHGHYRSKTWVSWMCAKNRCNYKKDKSYSR